MTQQYQALIGAWWKAERYEVVQWEGGVTTRNLDTPELLHIVAGYRSGIKTYDPFALYEQAAVNDRNSTLPYFKLIKVVESAGMPEDIPAYGQDLVCELAGRKEVQEAAVEWCNEFGPLGLFLHDLAFMEYPPAKIAPKSNQWAQQQVLKTSSGWQVVRREIDGEVPWTPEEQKAIYLDPPVSIFNEPGWRGLAYSPEESCSRNELDPITETLRHFISILDKKELPTRRIPYPTDEAFWQCYSEPLMDFVAAALLIRDAVEELRPLTKSRIEYMKKHGLDKKELIINMLAGEVRPHLVRKDDGFELHHRSTSLLGSLGTMILHDALKGGRLIVCANPKCRKSLIAFEPGQVSCFECRDTVKVNRYKNKKKEAIAAFKKGESPEKLSEKFDSDLETVQGWIAKALHKEGKSAAEIGEVLGLGNVKVRSLLSVKTRE